MKAITLTQPWASLVAIGAKRIETRSWKTTYRGALLIHAAKNFPGWARELCFMEDHIGDALTSCNTNVHALPLGAIVAVCKLIDCIQVTVDNAPTDDEFYFGDYTPGSWAWHLADIRALSEPIKCSGRLGLWNLKIGTLKGIEIAVLAGIL